ncbi:hypothetical protein B0T25DRAFT_578453 [Lasiosphaeria hispida]|uniref:Ecp2 effector protein domain-containing protein n=1 Tax=Lasiosphaeria hispida TaxID=260671 RepID=A0AAJ0MIQ8_9PEZI|nr:hypothetical protein B0T25DRAFT_578453 [Lasiosphaeria hispida]
MAVLRTITAVLVLGSLALFAPIAAAPTTTQQGASSSEVSAEIIEEQAAYWSHKFILDPATNHTIPNPAYAENSVLAKRANFNPPNGAECRISAQHYYYPKMTCSPGHGCEDDSYEVEELRILDNRNTNTNFAVFDMENGQEQYFQLNGHRGWIGAASSTIWQMYGLSSAYGRIEGRGSNRNMMGSDYCWYAEGHEWWGYWGEASCSSWCSDFNW